MEARHELLGGKVQLFKRPKSPFWQCSASISGNQYKVSSKLESLAQAKDFAEDWFLTLKGKERFGGGLAKGKKFRIASALFVSEYKALMATERAASAALENASACRARCARSSVSKLACGRRPKYQAS